MDRQKVLELLYRHLEAGTLQPDVVLPVIHAVAGGPAAGDQGAAPSRWVLLRALDGQEGKALDRLRRALMRGLLEDASRARVAAQRAGAVPQAFVRELDDLPIDAPRNWHTAEGLAADVSRVVRLYEERHFVESQAEPLPSALAEIERALQKDRETAGSSLRPWALISPTELLHRAPDHETKTRIAAWLEERKTQDVEAILEGRASDTFEDERAVLEALRRRFLSSDDREEQKRILHRVLAWPSTLAALVLPDLCKEPWAQDRASLILQLRLGAAGHGRQEPWLWWLRRLEMQRDQLLEERSRAAFPISGCEPTLLAHWYSCQPDTVPHLQRALDDWSRESLDPISADEFLRRTGAQLDRKEAGLIQSAAGLTPAPTKSPTPPPPVPLARPTPEPSVEAEAPPPPPHAETEQAPEAEPAPPSFWARHVQAFFAENWFMVAGILMVVVGASILAYFTWDTHWMIRYTIMPTLLGGFTFALAAMGRFLESREDDLKNAAAMMRGAAILLLPINFMAVTFLWGDPSVPGFVVPLMAAVYLAVFAWGLRSWCAAVHPALRWLAGGTLLFLNFLVFLRPLGTILLSVAGQPMRAVLGVGFYAGFLILSGAVIYFSERVLTEEMAREKRVPWFLGVTLGVTFLQVFAWVHGLAGLTPKVHTYAPMLVLAGGLVLYLERKGLELRGKTQVHEVESFLGFALVLLGVVMGAGNDVARIVSLLIAGAVWLHQAAHRKQDLHRWIGLTFLALGGAAIGLHAGFPAAWRPAIGLGLAALFVAASRWLLRRDPDNRTAAVAREMSAPILLLTAVVAVVTQWSEHSEPLYTAGVLVLIAAWFISRSVVEQRVRWLFTGMMLLATALPYLGCVDLSHRTWHGNTMVFGLAVLSWLWIAANAFYKTPVMRGARSTVLWTYGALAVVGMIVRVLLEPVTAADAEPLRVTMNYTGPLLMALALAVAGYTSRSIIPAFMAFTIVIILFPELKARFDEELKLLGWGTGIGSALNALWMTLICFPLRRWPRLQNLGQGDRFLGRYAFPLVRTDYKLFTWPLVVSALFLLARTNTITYARNLPDIPWLTSLALGAAAIGWTAQAVYHQGRRPGAVLGTHLGWISLILAVAHRMSWPTDWPAAQGYFLVLFAVLTGLYLLYRLPPIGSQPWSRRLLSSQIRWVLAFATIVFSALWTYLLPKFDSTDLTPWFVLMLAALGVWQGIRTKWVWFGGLLFFLCGVYVTARFGDPLRGDLSDWTQAPLLWYLLAIQVLLVGFAFWRRVDEPLRSLRQPLSLLSAGTLLLIGLMVAVLHQAGTVPVVDHRVLLLAGLLLAAWTSGSSAWVLVASLAGYAFVREDWFAPEVADGIAVLGAALVTWSLLGQYVERSAPALLRSRLAWAPLLSRGRIPWLPVPAAAFALLAVGLYALSGQMNSAFRWTWVPYLAAATLSAVALRTRWHVLHGLALAVITLGNVFAVNALVGDQLAAWGLSKAHTICLGLIVSLAEMTVLRLLVRSFRIRTYLARGCLALAGLVLVLLTINYVSRPDLASIQWQRFAISGVTALLAGLYFRYMARAPDTATQPHARLAEGMYHYALALSIGCFAMLVPFLRTPATAMFALGLPALYFYGRAELVAGRDPEVSARYRNSAGVISFILLGLYVLRPAFQIAFFPNDAVQVDAYHWNAPLVILLGFVMIRLRGLGASTWLAYFGGLALLIGSYFLLTWLPGLSPFSDPVPGAWCAVVLAHFWMTVSSSRSPLRTAIQRLGALDDEEWNESRASWGAFLLVAVHAAGFWGLSNCEPDMPRAFAPLLAGLATVVAHQAVLRRSRWLAALAGFEVLVALHADFFIESYVSVNAIVWILLALWTAALVLHAFIRRPLDVRGIQVGAAALFALCFAHALHHGLGSAAGLWAVGLATALAAQTPQERVLAEGDGERWLAAAFLFLPAWLTYFALVGPVPAVDDFFDPWPIGMTALVLVALASVLRFGATHLPDATTPLTPGMPRLIDHTRSVIRSSGRQIGLGLVWIALGVTALQQVARGPSALEVREYWLLLVLYAAVGWEGWSAFSERRAGWATVLVELSVIGFLVTLRNFVAQTHPDLWRAEYDVWASLILAMALTGSKQLLDRGPREVRLALLPGLFLLPVFSILWTLGHGLGTDLMLLVVGLHSLMFSYLGKDDRESPYRLVSIVGFVAFILITFHSKFEFREVHAYLIPVGLGILALVQMLRRHMSVDTRNRIRLATHLTMLASAGYYAIADDSHTIAFNVTLFLLCLASMAAGALLRIRLFLVMGFGGLVVSLASILFHVLKAMEHTLRLTSVGLLVLLVGVIFVMGTVYYKTHRDRVNTLLARWRGEVEAWE